MSRLAASPYPPKAGPVESATASTYHEERGSLSGRLSCLGILGRMAQLTLHTERLCLVPLADEHLEFEIELDSDPEVMRYITGRALLPDEVEQVHRRRLAAADLVPGLGFSAGFAEHEFVGWWILQPPNGPDPPRDRPSEWDEKRTAAWLREHLAPPTG